MSERLKFIGVVFDSYAGGRFGDLHGKKKIIDVGEDYILVRAQEGSYAPKPALGVFSEGDNSVGLFLERYVKPNIVSEEG